MPAVVCSSVVPRSPGGLVVVWLVLLALNWAAPGLGWSAGVERIEVEHHRGRFTLHAAVLLDVEPGRVRAILRQFDNLPRLTPSIQRVEVLDDPGGRAPVWLRLDAANCVLWFCLDYHWVQQVVFAANGDILTRFDPARSDFHHGRVHYQIEAVAQGSRLITDAELEPAFWLPPLVGPALVRRRLEREALATARRIEMLAAEKGQQNPRVP